MPAKSRSGSCPGDSGTARPASCPRDPGPRLRRCSSRGWRIATRPGPRLDRHWRLPDRHGRSARGGWPRSGRGTTSDPCGFVGEGPPKRSWAIITKVTGSSAARIRRRGAGLCIRRVLRGSPGGAPQDRPETERLESADCEQVRIEGVRDDRHHRDDRVDDEDVLGEERGREEEQRKRERGLRARVDAAVYHQKGGSEPDVPEARPDAGRHHLAHCAPSRTPTGRMDVYPVIDWFLPTAAVGGGPPRRSRSWPRDTPSGNRGPHIPF